MSVVAPRKSSQSIEVALAAKKPEARLDSARLGTPDLFLKVSDEG